MNARRARVYGAESSEAAWERTCEPKRRLYRCCWICR